MRNLGSDARAGLGTKRSNSSPVCRNVLSASARDGLAGCRKNGSQPQWNWDTRSTAGAHGHRVRWAPALRFLRAVYAGVRDGHVVAVLAVGFTYLALLHDESPGDALGPACRFGSGPAKRCAHSTSVWWSPSSSPPWYRVDCSGSSGRTGCGSASILVTYVWTSTSRAPATREWSTGSA